MKTIEREQYAGLLKGFVVFHHRRDGLGIGHRTWLCVSYPLGIISIMNRIVCGPSELQDENRGGVSTAWIVSKSSPHLWFAVWCPTRLNRSSLPSHLRRTTCPKIDNRGHLFFRIFL